MSKSREEVDGTGFGGLGPSTKQERAEQKAQDELRRLRQDNGALKSIVDWYEHSAAAEEAELNDGNLISHDEHRYRELVDALCSPGLAGKYSPYQVIQLARRYRDKDAKIRLMQQGPPAALPMMREALECVLAWMTNVNSYETETVARKVIGALKVAGGIDPKTLDDAAIAMLKGAAHI